MVVHGENFLGFAVFEAFSCLIHDEIDTGSALFVSEVLIDQGRTAAGVDEVVEAGAGYFVVPENLENAGDLVHVALVDGEAQTDFEPFGLAVLEAFKSLLERSLHAAEPVVNFLETVKGDAHVGEADAFEFLCLGLGDECAIG